MFSVHPQPWIEAMPVGLVNYHNTPMHQHQWNPLTVSLGPKGDISFNVRGTLFPRSTNNYDITAETIGKTLCHEAVKGNAWTLAPSPLPPGLYQKHRQERIVMVSVGSVGTRLCKGCR